MRIGIDASNIGGGGGVTHLKEILSHFDKDKFDAISKIVLFSSEKVLDQIKDEIFLEKVSFPEFNKGLIQRVQFQILRYDNEIFNRCDMLFSVTGDYFGKFRPLIGMSRNMLLYERENWREIKQPREVIRFWLNYQKQKKCFQNSEAVIFISDYAKDFISTSLNLSTKVITTIHHGISPRFSGPSVKQLSLNSYNNNRPFRFIYVSAIHTYKNHLNVVKAVSKLRAEGYPIELHLIGGEIFKPAGNRLRKLISQVDSEGLFIFWKGHISYMEIEKEYEAADGIIFASTCENMPNILLESMASGKAIACSNKPPMPEFLKDGGFYFDAKNVESIEATLKNFLSSPQRREDSIEKNKIELNRYSWKQTSYETFSFIQQIYSKEKYV